MIAFAIGMVASVAANNGPAEAKTPDANGRIAYAADSKGCASHVSTLELKGASQYGR